MTIKRTLAATICGFLMISLSACGSSDSKAHAGSKAGKFNKIPACAIYTDLVAPQIVEFDKAKTLTPDGSSRAQEEGTSCDVSDGGGNYGSNFTLSIYHGPYSDSASQTAGRDPIGNLGDWDYGFSEFPSDGDMDPTIRATFAKDFTLGADTGVNNFSKGDSMVYECEYHRFSSADDPTSAIEQIRTECDKALAHFTKASS